MNVREWEIDGAGGVERERERERERGREREGRGGELDIHENSPETSLSGSVTVKRKQVTSLQSWLNFIKFTMKGDVLKIKTASLPRTCMPLLWLKVAANQIFCVSR